MSRAVPDEPCQWSSSSPTVRVLVAFHDAWPGRLAAEYGDQSITVIGKAELVCNKRATGRAQDALDADVLERG